MKRCQDFRYRPRGALALRNAGKTPCPDGQRHRRAIQRCGIWSLLPRKPGALSCAATEQARVASTRACRIVHIRWKVRASNFAIPGTPGVALPTTVPGAAFRDSRRVRGTHGIGRRQRERFASHHSSKVNSVCAPTFGACCPFFPCGHNDAQREYHLSVTAAGSKCIPVGSAASTVTELVLPRRTAVISGNEPLIPPSTGPNSKLC
jgi:hypothetical protein